MFHQQTSAPDLERLGSDTECPQTSLQLQSDTGCWRLVNATTSSNVALSETPTGPLADGPDVAVSGEDVEKQASIQSPTVHLPNHRIAMQADSEPELALVRCEV